MRMVITKTSIRIVPDNEIDEAYLESVLGLENKGDSARAVRVAPFGRDLSLAYVEITKRSPK